MFRVIISPKAEKEFAKLSKELKQKLYVELKRLEVNPFNHPKVKKLQNTDFGYRLGSGRWRILFALFTKEKKIKIVDIFMRKESGDYSKRKSLIK